jgi:hypothetical protein
MSTLSKGALGMVFAGAVTFSATNALLVDQISILLTKENPISLFGHQDKADVISKAEKAVKDQTSRTKVKDDQTKISHENPASTNETTTTTNVTTKPSTSIKAPMKTTASASTGTNKTSAATRPAVKTKPQESAKASKTTTASSPTETTTTSGDTVPVATTKPSTSAEPQKTTTAPSSIGNAATETTNHGQQVSEAAKEKAASNQDQKENNGKKM